MPSKPKLDTNVLPCQWQKFATGWRLWIRGWPSITGEGETLDQATSNLTDALMREAPDLDRVLPFVPVFEPPVPSSAFAERYLRHALVQVSGDEIFEMHAGRGAEGNDAERAAYMRSLYREGLCADCGHGRGHRTDVPLRIDVAPSGARSGWVRGPIKHLICVYSERFLSLLTAQERAALSLAPIEMPRGTRQRFFELRGPAHAHPVGVRGLQADGIECTTCGRRTVEVIDPRLLEDGLNLKTFISDAFLAPSPPPAMAVGQNAEVTLCLPRRRWTELAEHRDAAGLIARPIGVIEQAECDQNPRVRMRVVSCEVCKTWPMPLTIERRERAAFDLPATDCAPSNFDWLAAAESNGRLIIATATIPAQAMFELAMRPGRPARTEFIAMRCPACWRLGWIVLSRGDAKLRLVWRYGLH